MPSISSPQTQPLLMAPNQLFQPRPTQSSDTTPTLAPGFIPPPQDTQTLSGQGQALTHVPLVSDTPPNWSTKTQAGIKAGFLAGLKEYKITPEELNQILKQFGISQLEITEASIQDPRNAAEIEYIQTQLNEKLGNKNLTALNLGKTLTPDGQFGKNSVQAVAALKDLWRGQPIEIPVTPIEQRTRTGCYMASEAMMYNAIHGKDGKSDAYTEFDFRDRVNWADREADQTTVGARESGTGRLSITRQRGIDMVNEIDAELEAGRPVIAGVSYRKQNGHEYNEGITDHFVTIAGRGYDKEGAYYLFHDPAQGSTNKFRFDPVTGKLSGRGDMAGVYDVSMISKAGKTDPATIEKYQKLGKTMFYQGQRSSEIKELQFKLSAMGYATNGIDGGYGNGTYKAVSAFQEANQLPVTGNTIDNYTLEAIEAKYSEWQNANPSHVLFKQGDNNSLLTPIQTKLTQLGFNTKGSKGSFGPATAQAVKDFQTQAGLPATGQLDNQTWLAILSAPKPSR